MHPCFRGASARSQQKRRSIERQAATRQSIRAAKPASVIATDTGSIPETEASIKKQGDDLDRFGACGYDVSAGSQGYAVYSAYSN